MARRHWVLGPPGETEKLPCGDLGLQGLSRRGEGGRDFARIRFRCVNDARFGPGIARETLNNGPERRGKAPQFRPDSGSFPTSVSRLYRVGIASVGQKRAAGPFSRQPFLRSG